ncbi:hypothetical protein HFU84_04340 [Acidithiobacillus sp. CV18-2]|uniref:Uncharacterized protein n=1 Tax=Igneacidithiobacillus copahuensis TaxID=2724909 RepID=A0AAE2YSI3_9PROT|nr:hypothetical protein [Igneacidithiobacillus copahuensis]MBU2754165.1 hypothetical protein [Acidithiobacillus sp. CV18-3]MBU2758472.1 hypothetical protein [Acidithiobacillus sp. BN09-2]MBU2776745.1 hypothetical protein [Acidithiobacillus sp. CV18-2]MBU2797069.1 hypothetical protein [Acidithiobacillus sp. VAN18-2]MBU2798482.1 hypothetical protein [Acidithiobacillus sp. VAN18-4]UTV80139.1 hypothetical protein MQE22_08895 [Acidithiobacillus sp. YTS05]
MFKGKTNITATWISKDGEMELEGFYHSVGNPVVNKDKEENETCRFHLVNVHDHDDNFDIVILDKKERVTFRADCYEENKEYPLNRFDSKDGNEIILVSQDKSEIIYFHLF